VGNYFRPIPPFTGGTVSGDTFFLGSVSSGTFFANSISGNTIFSGNTNLYNIFSTVDYFTTGSTFDSNTKIATFNRNDGNDYTLDLSTLSTVDTYVTGFTYDGINNFTIKQNEGQPDLSTAINDLSINNFSANTISGNTIFSGGTELSTVINNIASQYSGNTFVTGGTFNQNTRNLTLNRNDNQTVFITGFTDYFTTGSTFDSNTKIATFNRNDGNNYALDLSTLSTVDTFVTGFTYDGINNFTIKQNEGKPDLSAIINNLSVNNFSASTIFSGNTNLYNIFSTRDYFTTGSTFDSNTKIATFNRNDGNNYALDLSTLSTVDTYVTGFTYDNNTFTIKQNEGQPDLSATIETISLSGSLSSITFDIQTTGNITAANFFGNGSNLSGINFSQLATTAHTHPISDVINLQNNLDSKIDKPLNPFLGDYLYYNGVNWVPNQVNIPVAAGAGVTLFLSLTGSSLPSYEYLSQFPIELTETQESITVNNSQALIGKYATEQLNRTIIDSGIWEFNTFASVDIPSTGLTQIIISAYLLTTGGSETFLFSGETENITTTSPNIYTFSLAEQQYSCNTTDYLVVNYSASTTNNFNTTVTLYHGGTLNYSHIHTPFVTLHNDLAGIQGGQSNQYYHLSKNEVDLLTTGIDSSSIHNHDSLYLGLGGGTVSGQTNFTNGLYSNSISGNTIFSGNTNLYNIFSTNDYFTTGSTFDSNTKIATFNRNDGNDYTLDLSTLSTVDTFVTGFTYDGVNNFTIKQNEGQSDLNATINDLSINNFSASTISGGTIFSGGTILETIIQNIVSSYNSYLISGSTEANLLENTNNWDINGDYIGTPITGTNKGQKYYNNNYFFEAVANNFWIRLIRG
jgi:hypothetical protein